MRITKQFIDEIDDAADLKWKIYLAAKYYAEQGFTMIPLAKNGKKPLLDSWQTSGMSSPATVEKNFHPYKGKYSGYNLGLLMGKVGGLCCVDQDLPKPHRNIHEDGRETWAKLMQENGAVVTAEQKTPSGGVHTLFRRTDNVPNTKIGKSIDLKSGTDNDFSSYVVVYPSVVDDTQYRWIKPSRIADAPEWLASASNKATTVETVPDYIDLSKSRGSSLVGTDDEYGENDKYGAEQAEQILALISPENAEDSEWINIAMSLKSNPNIDEADAYRLFDEWSAKDNSLCKEGKPRYKPDELAKRWASIDAEGNINEFWLVSYAKNEVEAAGEKFPWGIIKGNTLVTGDEVIDRYNGSFCVVRQGSDTLVAQYTEKPAMGRDKIELFNLTQFKQLCATDSYEIRGRTFHNSEVWFHDQRRREANGGLVFKPEIHEVFFSRDGYDYVNLWEGYPVEPKQGDWSIFKEHVENIFGEISEWALDWFADIFQNPADLKGTSLVVKSREGVGKGSIVKVFQKLFGRHYKHMHSYEQLTEKHNDWRKNAMLVVGDEVTFGGNKKTAGILKGMVSDPSFMLREMNRGAVPWDNYMRLFLFSNEDWVIPAGTDSRRWAVVEPDIKPEMDRTYYNRYHAFINTEDGIAAILHGLLNRKITHDLRTVPVTEALQEERSKYKNDRNTIVDFLSVAIANGNLDELVPVDEIRVTESGDTFIRRGGMFKAFEEYCEEKGGAPFGWRKFDKEIGVQGASKLGLPIKNKVKSHCGDETKRQWVKLAPRAEMMKWLQDASGRGEHLRGCIAEGDNAPWLVDAMFFNGLPDEVKEKIDESVLVAG
ncbi:bifunctional DNA primase/polymerase [Litoribrevibacter euphylliae]|uniref:Bifunctional DNA primase/polymerase n=1 Tax=Litoribrevibacter euphylliae TaxID=1834034 RepID=A0ABV7HCJ4_9GAMM